MKVDDTLGVTLIGNIIQATLFGFTNVQMHTYFTKGYFDDARWFKAIIVLLWLFDTAQIVFPSYSVYSILITHYGDPSEFFTPERIAFVHVLVTEISCFIIRIIYAGRLWTLGGKNRSLLVAVLILSVIALVPGFIYMIRGLHLMNWEKINSSEAWVMFFNYGAAFAVDSVIAAAMCMCMQRGGRGAKSSDTRVHVMTLYVVGTGAITAFCALVTLILYVSMRANLVYATFYLWMGKLSINALMVNLNNRGPTIDKHKDSKRNSVNFLTQSATSRFVAGAGHIASAKSDSTAEIAFHNQRSTEYVDLSVLREDSAGGCSKNEAGLV
ncbi:hypothetical protein PUNSTDRAFT_125996 [Punctularia strigosozonata HHB-11173 SS5]|uniref:uncharacterized protein n=1 Tax=Punctularia strigosozonata (strain HHB-11173) TaxID=741275 RepID=UPI0004416D60|nr:uncharacterized protein PUNSTDRAFT_125996 [Punctularia strigosozonata HHB-11173 SS5]EIN10085.1 hypothetical protein PUNSTDRAFT_125996 [Punctularia strigosozonata HHB-11173 SS5]